MVCLFLFCFFFLLIDYLVVDKESEQYSVLRRHEERVSTARNKAVHTMIGALNKFMLELDEISREEQQVAMNLLANRLEYQRKEQELTRYAHMSSAELPLYIWLETQGIPSNAQICYLSEEPISPNEPKTAVTISSQPLDGATRVYLYRNLVREVVYRTILNLPLYGVLPPDSSKCKEFNDILTNGLILWKEKPSIVSRQPVDNLVRVKVADMNDVLAILNDPHVQPFYKIAKTFALVSCNPNTLPSEQEWEQMKQNIPSNAIANPELMTKLQVCYDALLKITQSTSGPITIPPNYHELYLRIPYGGTAKTQFEQICQHQYPRFYQYFKAMQCFFSRFWDLVLAVPSSHFQNPNLVHINLY